MVILTRGNIANTHFGMKERGQYLTLSNSPHLEQFRKPSTSFSPGIRPLTRSTVLACGILQSHLSAFQPSHTPSLSFEHLNNLSSMYYFTSFSLNCQDYFSRSSTFAVFNMSGFLNHSAGDFVASRPPAGFEIVRPLCVPLSARLSRRG